MRASLMTKAGSLAAAAAIATTGAMAATGAAGAATALPRLPTSLTAQAIPVPHSPRTLILGRLSSHKVPLRGLVVFLDRKSGKILIQVTHSVTDKFGDVGFIVAPKKPSQYVLIFKGTKNFAPSSSRFVTAK